MAKFTKLNIGDAVASSGGRVWKKLSSMLQLSAPTLSLDGSMLTITDDSGLATSFDILADGEVKGTATSTTFDLSALELAEGTYDITVVAKADGYKDSAESEAVSYEVAAAEDELQGTWVFTAPAFTIPYDFYSRCGQRVNVTFTSNGRFFSYIEYNDTGSLSGDELYYDMRLVIEGGQTSQGAWISDGYKTVNIESKLSEVTNGSALLTWLKANATKQ